ncbi:S8 family serine peptidase [Pseudomonas asiatica]|uniref:S8 family serine peptidase n=1 Tax=Pseudomonas asiatica TaxID=2219225 RepID=UPI0015FD0374|nr:S8 family serine peptidase [Pseudomonas asiatica]MBA6111826.1 S8 family serine peptidase [Pseudomonas asiatica]
MKKELAISRRAKFDNTIHLRLLGYLGLVSWGSTKHIKSIEYTLYSNDIPSGSEVQERIFTTGCSFTQVKHEPKNQYHGKVVISYQDGTTEEHVSKKISITDIEIPSISTSSNPSARVKYFSTKENFRPSPDCSYYIEIQFETDGLERFRKDDPLRAIQNKVGHLELTKNPVRRQDLYSITQTIEIADMLSITQILSKLDYVRYAALTPTPHSLNAKSPDFDNTTEKLPVTELNSDQTPDFTGRQGYLDAISATGQLGMNVREAWRQSVGSHATVRHLDFGVYEDHEDLKGHITIATNGKSNKEHGTASTGVIAAMDNGVGIKGVAHDCNFIYYDKGTTMEPILDDVLPGDIVSLDIQTADAYPIIAYWSWWSKIKAVVERGGIVFMAAGNGLSDLAWLIEKNLMEDFGDSGAFLVAACQDSDGRIQGYSNYNHYGLLVNSWGSPRVVTTGYGDLFSPDSSHTRDYTARFAGTSSALPLVVGVAALLQSYSIEQFNLCLTAKELVAILAKTGYTEGSQDKIGHRPNAEAAFAYLYELVSASSAIN